MVGAAWVTEEERNRTSGNWGSVGRGKEWGGAGEDGGAQQRLGEAARVRQILEGLRSERPG